MRKNSLAWFAIGFAIAALINSIVVGYFGLHSHDEFYDTIYSLPKIGGEKGEVLQKDDSGNLTWQPDFYMETIPDDLGWIISDDTVHSKAYGSYPAQVPFEQGMTLWPGQSATMTLGLEITEDEFHALFGECKN